MQYLSTLELSTLSVVQWTRPQFGAQEAVGMFNHMDFTDRTTPLAPLLLQITLGCDRCIVLVPF